MKVSSLLILCSLLTGGAGCDTPPPQQQAAPKQALLTPEPTRGAAGLTGQVLETMDAAGYSYLKLSTAKGQRWAAVRKAEIKVGSRVTIVNAMEMKNFKSKTLDRTFPSITFGQLSAAGGPAAHKRAQVHGTGAGMKRGDPHAGLPGFRAKGQQGAKAHRRIRAARQTFATPLPPAPGGLTISALHTKRADLAGKPVTVRGKVVKYNGGIMGRNWIHLQDGSGTAEASDYDLTVTSKAAAKVGQVLEVKGVLSTDRDFGAGYTYDVIIEDATPVLSGGPPPQR